MMETWKKSSETQNYLLYKDYEGFSLKTMTTEQKQYSEFTFLKPTTILKSRKN